MQELELACDEKSTELDQSSMTIEQMSEMLRQYGCNVKGKAKVIRLFSEIRVYLVQGLLPGYVN